jgi:hypothetical protein
MQTYARKETAEPCDAKASKASARASSEQGTAFGSLPEVLNQSPAVQAQLHLDRALNQGARTVQRKANDTGLPDDLKAGIENLSGLSLDGVKVHYNSPAPAQLQALAYAQDTDIHVGPGQEEHVPHEAWHVVQQMQRRVRPTMKAQGVDVNDDPALEQEADRMGRRAAQGEAARSAERVAMDSKRAVAQQRAALDGASAVQRKVNLDAFFSDEDRERLFSMGLGIDDIEEIQDLLGDEEEVAALLQQLEGETEEQFWEPENELKYTRALGAALYNQESKWMNVDPEKDKDLETISGQQGVESTDRFLGHIATVKPLKDVGAAISHGEYAHRMQWYAISKALENNFAEMYGEDFLEKEGRPSENYKWLLQSFYSAMAEPEYTKMFEEGNVRQTDEQERNAPGKGQFPLPLWSAVLDMPGSFVDLAGKDQRYEMFGDIFAAAPVKLTGGLTFSAKGEKGSLQQGPLAYSQTSLAVLNRRLKRYFEGGKGRTDAVLDHALKSSEDTEVQEILSNRQPGDPLDYDQRNEIAFRLLGIL